MKRLLAVAAVVAAALFITLDWSRFLQDFWPVDAARVAPNIVAAFIDGGCRPALSSVAQGSGQVHPVPPALGPR